MKLIFITLILLLVPTSINASKDNDDLAKVYEKDQEMRNGQNIESWPLYSPLEERNFRLTVFKLIAHNKLKTENDYYHAAIVLLHSSVLERENFLLAGFLGEKLINMGDTRGTKIIEIASSKYALTDNLPSERWLMYKVDDKLVTYEDMMKLKGLK